MKRYAALLLAVLLLLGSLAACKENAQPQVEATEAPAITAGRKTKNGSSGAGKSWRR